MDRFQLACEGTLVLPILCADSIVKCRRAGFKSVISSALRFNTVRVFRLIFQPFK